MRIKSKVSTLKLRKNFRELASFGDATLDEDIKDALEPMREQTVLNARTLRQPGPAPKGGHLDEGIVTRKVSKRGKRKSTWWLSYTKRARKIAHLVEFGTAPHFQPNRFGGIMHPGARQTPFARTAFESKKTGVVRTLGDRLWTRIKSKARGLRK